MSRESLVTKFIDCHRYKFQPICMKTKQYFANNVNAPKAYDVKIFGNKVQELSFKESVNTHKNAPVFRRFITMNWNRG